ncbi:hypothetical protein GTP44_23925 [Duganella sp. FT50W]|uniref:Uncharacterized protein n=1 Tax=Duganella lactea TaxID=2692173 RepID=A0A6L8MSG8_9BURK|nr:hypothetical protein [Duganella lactea]MYM84982.1 hypothetical protein [Duganella lactea]
MNYYANDFMASIKAVAHLHKLSKKASSGAKAIHSLNYLPQLTATQFDQLIANRSADALGIYDVGQGSAVALCKAHSTGQPCRMHQPDERAYERAVILGIGRMVERQLGDAAGNRAGLVIREGKGWAWHAVS